MNIKQLIAGMGLLSIISFTSCDSEDAELKSNVSTAVQNDEVSVSTEDGVVTLSGEVKDPAAKAKAEADARSVKGVTTVKNEITFPEPPPPPAVPNADEKLNAEVQAVIAPFPDVRASVSGGVVTLSGEITRPGMALLMPRIAGLFPKKIENNIEIK